jgi:hypothetical protein
LEKIPENVLKITVKEQQQAIGSLPSLTKQRRDVFAQEGDLEAIKDNAALSNVIWIAGSKNAQNYAHPIDKKAIHVTASGP